MGAGGRSRGRFPLFENQPCTKSDMTHLISDDGLGCRLGGGGFPGEGVECAQIKPLPNQS